MTSTDKDQLRRLRPSLFDTDWMVLSRLTRVIELLAAQEVRSGDKALDFGCGSKPYEPLFRAAGVEYHGADFDTGAELPIDANGVIACPDAYADLVLSFQVLEHVRDLETYFNEARRVLKPGGRMILSTHGTWFYHPHPEDHRRWTRTGLVNELESNGFEVLETIPVVGPLAWTTVIRLTSFCFAMRQLPVIGRPLAAALAFLTNLRIWVEEAVTPAWATNDNACIYVTLSRPK
jgi:SAM-dependent methyltransferase